MSSIDSLPTPSFLVDLDILQRNIEEMAKHCRQHGKELWPMVKTHKSTAIAGWQLAAGAGGFLVGTIKEAEQLVDRGFTQIMVAYPVAGPANIARLLKLARQARIILSFDGAEAAAQWDEALSQENLVMEYLLIIDVGLHRLGVLPEEAAILADRLACLKNLRFCGIGTHPGHVYAAASSEEVCQVAGQEVARLKQAKDLLQAAGYEVLIAASGSTPTVGLAAANSDLTVLRPGNYVFYDAIQVALGVVPPDRCALTVLATVISNPKPGLFIMDAGSKCLGLDKGAHGIALTVGYGMIKNRPDLVIESLSEEVGKIRAVGAEALKVGDRIEIIPNHSCAAANMTSRFIGHSQGQVQQIIPVDARGGT